MERIGIQIRCLIHSITMNETISVQSADSTHRRRIDNPSYIPPSSSPAYDRGATELNEQHLVVDGKDSNRENQEKSSRGGIIPEVVLDFAHFVGDVFHSPFEESVKTKSKESENPCGKGRASAMDKRQAKIIDYSDLDKDPWSFVSLCDSSEILKETHLPFIRKVKAK